MLGLALRGVAALETERTLSAERERRARERLGLLASLRERHRLLEVLLDIQRSISHRKPLSEVLGAVTAGASGLLGGCPVALVLEDPLAPDRPIVASTTAGGEWSESELAIVATAAAQVGSAPGMDPALAAAVHINGARAGALVAMAPSGAAFDDAQLGMLDAFAEHASLALTDARTVEAMEEAFHDSLTGLPNRALFLDRLAHALDVRGPARDRPVRAVRRPRPLQGRQRQLGHAAGDELLRAVAERLRDCTARGGHRGRFGGDEFAVLLEDDGAACSPSAVAARIIAAMRRPFHVEGNEVYVGASVGIAHAARRGAGPDELLRDADLAMYRAKKAGGKAQPTRRRCAPRARAPRARGRPAPRARARGAVARLPARSSSSRTGRPVGVEASCAGRIPTAARSRR